MKKLPYRRIADTVLAGLLAGTRRGVRATHRMTAVFTSEVGDLCAGPATTAHLRHSPINVDEIDAALRAMRRDAA